MRLRKLILNLFGIEAILPKGSSYVLIEKGGKLEANGPSSFENLSFVNVAFHVLDENEGFAITANTKEGRKRSLSPRTIPSDKFWEEAYKAIRPAQLKN